MADIYLDLKSIFDTRLFFGKGGKAHTPLSDYHYPAEIFRGGRAEVGDILFERGDALGDCACCAGQEVSVNGFYAGAVALAGISTWGYYEEDFALCYEDGSEGKIRARFSDSRDPLFRSNASSYKKVNAFFNRFGAPLLGPCACRDAQLFIYRCEGKADGKKLLVKIRFPENELMYVFGITLKV